MEGLLATVARVLQSAARNPIVRATFNQLARQATVALVRYVRNQTRRRSTSQGSWR
jgi:hypothetical protein